MTTTPTASKPRSGAGNPPPAPHARRGTAGAPIWRRGWMTARFVPAGDLPRVAPVALLAVVTERLDGHWVARAGAPTLSPRQLARRGELLTAAEATPLFPVLDATRYGGRHDGSP